MEKYEKLLTIFSEVLQNSTDYHIAYIYNIGYVSLYGLYDGCEKQNSAMVIDEVFDSPSEMADSLLLNWRWQWFYDNRHALSKKDYSDIRELDNDIPDELREEYICNLHDFQERIYNVLQE